MNERGEVEWIPPPALDTGQTRINTYHRPERLLRPPDQEPPSSPDAGLQSDGGPAESTPSGYHDRPGETPCGDNHPINHELIGYELTGDAPIDHEPSDDKPINDKSIDGKPMDDGPRDDGLRGDEPIDYALTEPSPNDHPGETEEPDEPSSPREPGDPDKPDKSRGPGQPGGPTPPGGQAA